MTNWLVWFFSYLFELNCIHNDLISRLMKAFVRSIYIPLHRVYISTESFARMIGGQRSRRKRSPLKIWEGPEWFDDVPKPVDAIERSYFLQQCSTMKEKHCKTHLWSASVNIVITRIYFAWSVCSILSNAHVLAHINAFQFLLIIYMYVL